MEENKQTEITEPTTGQSISLLSSGKGVLVAAKIFSVLLSIQYFVYLSRDTTYAIDALIVCLLSYGLFKENKYAAAVLVAFMSFNLLLYVQNYLIPFGIFTRLVMLLVFLSAAVHLFKNEAQ